MKTFTSSLLITALGLSFGVNAIAASVPACTSGPKYAPYKAYQKYWKTLIAQSVPSDKSQTFCAQPTSDGLQQGALQGIFPFAGTLQFAASVQSSSQIYWVPRNPNNPTGLGNFQGTVSVVAYSPYSPTPNVPILANLYKSTDYLELQEDGSYVPCILSAAANDPQEGVFQNFDLPPNMFWYIVKGANGSYIDGTTFFFNTIAADGTTDKFAYFKNNLSAGFGPAEGTTTIPNQFLEVYYTKMRTSECHVNDALPPQ